MAQPFRKRWKVTTTYVSFSSLWFQARGMPTPEPIVTEKTYRWRWLAALAALSDNAFNAFNPAFVFGFVSASVTRL